MAAKQLVRLHEELQEFIYLWRGGEPRLRTSARRDCLGWMVLICCEVPRWRVPAAPVLIQDPVRLSRAVQQATQFFREVLEHPALPSGKSLKMTLPKAKDKKKTGAVSEKDEKQQTLEEHLNAYDAVLEAYLNR